MVQGHLYVALLSANDYSGFRDRDPSLPEFYSAWLIAFYDHVRALRQRGANVVIYPIGFGAFAERNDTFGILSFDEVARDDYAAGQAAAEAIADRA